eukprot:Nk52_evm65s239 gene=Nk52_evmTU65s239
MMYDNIGPVKRAPEDLSWSISDFKNEKNDAWDEDGLFSQEISREPPAIMVMGKPGSGVTTFAKRLAEYWKTEYISPTTALEEALEMENERAADMKSLLMAGQEVPEEMVIECLKDKMNAPGVEFRGYVLEGLPTACKMSVEDQLELVEQLKCPPRYVINLSISDDDLRSRRTTQRVFPETNEVFTEKRFVEPVVDISKDEGMDDNEEEEEEEEEAEEEGDEEEEVKSVDSLDLIEPLDSSLLAPEIIEQLVKRPEDYMMSVSDCLEHYDKMIFPKLIEFVKKNEEVYLLDTCATVDEDSLFKGVLKELKIAQMSQVTIPHALDFEDESLDVDKALTQLATLLDDDLPLKLSKWGKYCPVTLHLDKKMVLGNPIYSVGYLGKLFLMSSSENKEKFLKNPKMYLSTDPRFECKLWVVGPPMSGKTTQAELLSEHYNVPILNVEAVINNVMQSNNYEILPFQEKISEHCSTGETISPEIYAEVIEQYIKTSEIFQASSGWIFDGFPCTSEQASALHEKGIIPEHIVVLSDDAARERLAERKNVKIEKGEVEQDEQSGFTDIDLPFFDMRCDTFSANVSLLQSHFSQLNMTFTPLKYSHAIQKLFLSIMNAVDPFIISAQKTVIEDFDNCQWGDVGQFCPIKLKQGFLFPGVERNAVEFMNRVYLLSTDEAEETFTENPSNFVKGTEMAKVPALKGCLIGGSGSGKSTQAKIVAEKYDCDHILYKDFLKSLLKSDFEFASEIKEFFVAESIPFPEGPFDFSDEALKAIVDKLIFNGTEDSQSYRGYIAEGFPRTKKEAQYLIDNGLLPDFIVNLNIEGDDAVKRCAPELLQMLQIARIEEKAKIELANYEAEQARLKEEREEQERLEAERRKEEAEDSQLSEQESDIPEEPEETEEEVKDEGEKNESPSMKEDETVLDEEQDQDGEEEEAEKKGTPEAKPTIEETSEKPKDPTAWIDRLPNAIIERLKVPPEEEPDDEEQEMYDSLAAALNERASQESEDLSQICNIMRDGQVPVFEIDGSQRISIVTKAFLTAIFKYTEARESLFTTVTELTTERANKLLLNGQRHLSKFGKWCPVNSHEKSSLFPIEKGGFPCAYRHYIYYCSSEEARSKFMENAVKYISLPAPSPSVPFSLAILGPPKSGKSTVASKLQEAHGCIRLSLGLAVRMYMEQMSHTSMAKQAEKILRKGQALSTEMEIDMVKEVIGFSICRTKGFIFDGFPSTSEQMEQLEKHNIIPSLIIELSIGRDEAQTRAKLAKEKEDRDFVSHDGPFVTNERYAIYEEVIEAVRAKYTEERKNWVVVNGFRSKWWVKDKVEKFTIENIENRRRFQRMVVSHRPAPVGDMCIAPSYFSENLSKFGNYCPVALKDMNEIVDCSQRGMTYALQYKKTFYNTENAMNMKLLIQNPDYYLQNELPTDLPTRCKEKDVRALFPKGVALKGFCPVSYHDNNYSFNSIVPGKQDFMAEYKDEIYLMKDEENLLIFMRKPYLYCDLQLPKKLPPIQKAVNVAALPMLGFMEQTVATAVINALTALSAAKPKCPFVGLRESALRYIGYHLKANNPKSKDYIREKYEKKMKEYEENTKLIEYLGKVMAAEYMPQEERPIDFDHKLTKFLALRKTRYQVT